MRALEAEAEAESATPETVTAEPAVSPPVAAAEPAPPAVAASLDAAPKGPVSDLDRVTELARQRAALVSGNASPIGPGDLLKVTVSDVPELNLETRVGTDGRILLPLVGAIVVTGRSEAQLSAELSSLLVEKRFVRNPRVAVFLSEQKSQTIAVTGAVAKPGMFPLTRRRSTIIDMLSEAGGLSKDAGEVIEFVPAPESEAASPGKPDPHGVIQIDVNELFRGRNRTLLNLTVTSGDVIFVPEAGSFTINGWVDKPGTYPLTRRTAVVAAIASAGGPLFPARLGNVVVLREGTTSGDPPRVINVNVKDVQAGISPDTTLRAGDVVQVPAWPHLLPAWGAYSLVKNLISISAGIPIF
jgi:polysaccharide biosynthesis/export protein